jgi:hypothetical protein
MSDRPKARIIKVGTEDADGIINGFLFDCYGIVPGVSVEVEGVFYGGYTVDELREIVRSGGPDIVSQTPERRCEG